MMILWFVVILIMAYYRNQTMKSGITMIEWRWNLSHVEWNGYELFLLSKKMLLSQRLIKYVGNCPKINLIPNLFIWILIFMTFVPTNASVNSTVHKYPTLNRQVFSLHFFFVRCIFSFKFDFLKYVMHFIFNCITKPSVHRNITIVHSFSFRIYHYDGMKCKYEIFKLTKVSKMKKFIMDFISTLLMRTIRWCVSFTSNTLVLFQFYWHVFFFVCLLSIFL